MSCPVSDICGGCSCRDMEYSRYKEFKVNNIKRILTAVNSSSYQFQTPIFINDGTRRRASMNFAYKHKCISMGFNKNKTNQIVDINKCPLLTPKLNHVLPFIRNLLENLCAEQYSEKKGKKLITKNICGGDVFICEVDNGIDLVLEIDCTLSMNHRMIIFELSQTEDAIIRISHRHHTNDEAETIIEKSKPFIRVGEYDVFVPAGTFLQPSHDGQKALGDIVSNYLRDVKGNIADLFCGVGTFSYMLASYPNVKIKAIDSSSALLNGFQESINRNKINNISIINKNLFKYPLASDELKDFTAIIFDPPRSGAKAVCLALANSKFKPDIIVAISCNPATFVNDANILIDGGYNLDELTMVDQFIYSNHSELVARFTKKHI